MLHPRIEKWFKGNIGNPTDLQLRTWRKIKDGNNVLVISPTGSGKTLSAVIPAVDEIVNLKTDRSRTSILYITPMKALGADMMRTLEDLSMGLGRIEGKKERKRGRRRNDSRLPDAPLDVGIRTGDVPQSTRRRMLADPPDLLVVTPENLLLMACSKARETLSAIRYVIIDEVHEMVSSKRGALLSLTVEYLVRKAFLNTGREPQRIGLSATVKPETIAARYLGGLDDRGRLRNVEIVKQTTRKKMEIEIRTLFSSLDTDDMLREKVLKDIAEGIRKNRESMVVFHNTRKQAEEMAYALTGRGVQGVLPHHGSLGADVRREAEEGLKEGRLKAIISSTSLELGIDIGRVGNVYQVSSPKDPGKLLQRLGRSGHGLGRISRGTIYPTGPMDLLECLAVTGAASRGELESLRAQESPMDVLAQFMIGLTLVEDGIGSNEIWKIARSSYPYRRMKENEILRLLDLMIERLPGPTQPPPRLWMDDDGGLHPRRNTRQAFYLNCGTIPKETTFKVVEKNRKRMIGTLSREFGEALYERDVILLGSRSYRVMGFRGSSVMVKDDPDSQPTIPRWSGEVNPRPTFLYDRILKEVSGKSRSRGRNGDISIDLDENGQRMLASLKDHMTERSILPSRDSIPVEIVKTGRERRQYIFHIPMGRRVTETLGRVMAYGLRKNLGAMVDHTATDDGFAISTPAEIPGDQLLDSLGGNEFKKIACELILTSSMFRTRFSHILAKSLIVLTRFRGKDTSAIYRRNRVRSILDILMKEYYSVGGWGSDEGSLGGLMMLGEEAMNEVLRDKMDLPTTVELVSELVSGRIELRMAAPTKKASIPGERIVSTWKTRKSPGKKDTANRESMNKVSVFDAGSVTGTDDTLRDLFISTMKGSDTGGEGGSGDFLEAPLLISNMDKNRCRRLEITTSELSVGRIRSTFSGERTSGVLRSVPFFSHPADILNRSDRTDILSIRSLLKGGNLTPFRIMGADRLVSEYWEEIFLSLTPEIADMPPALLTRLRKKGPITRLEIGAICGSKGDELTTLIENCLSTGLLRSFPEEARFHLGACKGLFSPGIKREVSKGRDGQLISLARFLKRLGPFSLGELSMIFSWPGDSVPVGLIRGIADGVIGIGFGPDPPMIGEEITNNGKGDHIWVWSMERGRHGVQASSLNGALMEIDGPFRNGDPALVLTGRDMGWLEKEKVKSSVTSQFCIVDIEGNRASWTVLERMDRISIRSLEVEEYSNLKDLAERCFLSVQAYERMGYTSSRIENILGVPAGIAAIKARQPFLTGGYEIVETLKGEMLERSPPRKKKLDQDDMLRDMLSKQHLYPGTHILHPLQAVELLGGISDRWEILSRTGSRRSQRMAFGDTARVRNRIDRRWEELLRSIEADSIELDDDWSALVISSFEDISNMKDLTKRFGLHTGKMDQTIPVWTFRKEIERFATISGHRRTFIHEDTIETYETLLARKTEDLMGSKQTRNSRDQAHKLLEAGLASEDPWGDIIPIRPVRRSSERKKGSRTRGALQRAYTLRCCAALGTFRMDDLMEYAPDLEDVYKVRSILGDLLKGPIELCTDTEGEGEMIYRVKTGETEGKNTASVPEIDELLIISPRDRMWRVVSSHHRGVVAKGRGFIIMKGTRPVAHLIMRKMARSPGKREDGENIQSMTGKEFWMIKKAWLDPRQPRDHLMRMIRKRFFDLGLEVMTEDEKLKIEDLYREMDSREENKLS